MQKLWKEESYAGVFSEGEQRKAAHHIAEVNNDELSSNLIVKSFTDDIRTMHAKKTKWFAKLILVTLKHWHKPE